MSRHEETTLTREQEQRLVDAFDLIVAAELMPVVAPQTNPSFWRRPLVVPTLVFLAALGFFLPFRLIGNEAPGPSDVSTPVQESPATTLPVAPEPDAATAGDPSRVEGATVLSDLIIAGDGMYTVGVGEVDQILRSVDGGRTWEPVLTADPGDAEGLFAAGDLVVQVVEDDDPVRDSVEPGSAVSESLRVLVYDPATGGSTETILPRPEDPDMKGLPMDGSSGCALAGYQSWVRAEGVAVGDRLLVVGSHQLVGELTSGEVICGDQSFRHLAWVSDDEGVTWELHEAPALASVVWTGQRFVGWSSSDETGASRILVSDDGVTWTTAATTPPAVEGLVPVGPPQLAASGDRVIGLTEFHAWAAEIPENVTDPEDLREALGIGTDPESSPAEILEMLGIDIPLDDDERGIIQRFNGSTKPAGAFIATSDDGGATWVIESADRAITGVTIAEDLYLALTPQATGDASVLLSSDSGGDWTQVAELPIVGAGPTLAATPEAVFVADANTGDLWTVPIHE
ncbi:MAG: hypothetical protein PVG83_07760 [Acidimicrobiia bacterium]|jgi:hypothetical protein